MEVNGANEMKKARRALHNNQASRIARNQQVENNQLTNYK